MKSRDHCFVSTEASDINSDRHSRIFIVGFRSVNSLLHHRHRKECVFSLLRELSQRFREHQGMIKAEAKGHSHHPSNSQKIQVNYCERTQCDFLVGLIQILNVLELRSQMLFRSQPICREVRTIEAIQI